MISKLTGLILVTASLVCVYFFESSGATSGHFRIFHWPAMVLTGVGPIGLVLLCVDWVAFQRMSTLVFGASPAKRHAMHEKETRLLYKLSEAYYAEGAEAFEKIKTKAVSRAVIDMIERLAVRIPTPDIREMLNKERDKTQIRVVQALNVAGLGVKLAPSMGMLGTILGMVRLLSTLNDPGQIGSHMSLALLTTFFGLFFSLVLWTPLQQKLERILDVELERYDQAIRWLELLEKRKPADYFAENGDTTNPHHVVRNRAAS